MQRIVIDCQTRQAVCEDVPPEEEVAIVKERQQNAARQQVEERRQLKRALARELAELREMRGAPLVFDAADLAEKQAVVEELQRKISDQQLKSSGPA